mmetsp:Transcript_17615/g.49842  ORF Transcript_17615/g.49842 Transcript_17615/m.49842 type:complete len:231 (-) Transcript_17615:812-1504(-)
MPPCHLVFCDEAPAPRFVELPITRSSWGMTLSSMSRITSFCSRININKSKFRASPMSRATPDINSCAVSLPSPSASTNWKTIWASSTSKSMDAIHVCTSGSFMVARNSRRSSRPSPVSSAASNNLSIFFACVFIARSRCRIMSWSSVVATLNVSWINTPLITPMTAKPMVSLCATKNTANHSLTYSDSILQGSGKSARVISKVVRTALENEPQYSNTFIRSDCGYCGFSK